MSSLVTTADRRTLPRRTDEAGGEIESLAGRIDPKEMGQRARVQDPAKESKKAKAAAAGAGQGDGMRVAASRKRQSHKDILAATDEMEGLNYRPSTAENRQTFELILTSAYNLLGDQSQDVVRSAADVILETIKDESKKDLDKKRHIEREMGTPLSAEQFGDFVNLCKKITDFNEAEDGDRKDADGDAGEADIDEDVGVAVVFEEEEDEDQMDADEEEEPNFNELSADEGESGDEAPTEGEDLDNTVQIGARSPGQAKTSQKLTARDIDGFWLQRLIASSYPDPILASEKTTEALSLLSSEISARDLENSLMELFDYEHFESVQILVANRERVVWCTRLARASENERADVEVAMREKGAGWILKELTNASAKREADDSSNAGPSLAQQQAMSQKSSLAPGALGAGKAQMVDLESMIFSQGARLMSNKRVKLPDGSTKRSFKTHEEIHIPVPPKVQHTDKLLNVAQVLPHWAGECLHTNQLNRIQSKVYPTAWVPEDEEEQNMLICAPTGAGKVRCLHSPFLVICSIVVPS